MLFISRITITGLLAATALAGSAVAQDLAMPDLGNSAVMSPYGFAKSDMKAKFRAEAEAAAQDSAGRVLGGEIAAEGAWPWQVALVIPGRPLGPDAQFCGGTLILDQWVLTAGHCVYMDDGKGGFQDLRPEEVSVVVGTNKLVPGAGDTVPVAAVFSHPEFYGGVNDNDIALLKLARKPTVPYRTIQVPDADLGEIVDQPGVPTVVTGWGLINGGKHPEDMYQGVIQMLDRQQCNAAVMEGRANRASDAFVEAANAFRLSNEDAQAAWDELARRAPPALSQNMLCSGTFEGGRTSCSGDSGGPLVVALNDGSYVQAGVVSWGLSTSSGNCVETAQFSVYTKVANYLPWLEQTIAQN